MPTPPSSKSPTTASSPISSKWCPHSQRPSKPRNNSKHPAHRICLSQGQGDTLHPLRHIQCDHGGNGNVSSCDVRGCTRAHAHEHVVLGLLGQHAQALSRISLP